MATPESEIARYDLAIVGKRRNQRVAPQGIQAVVRFLAASGVITRVDVAAGEGWTELRAAPGDIAHAILHQGESTGVTPAFRELAIRSGTAGTRLGYGVDEPLFFFVEIRGAAFATVTQDLLERLDAILYLRPEVFGRPHVGLRRDEVAGAEPEAPPARVQHENVRDLGRAGTRVEELD